MKFKVGDKVVRISTESDYRITGDMFDVGDSFIVGDITDGGKGRSIYWDFVEAVKHGVYEDELELESVYNSKLYKALK